VKLLQCSGHVKQRDGSKNTKKGIQINIYKKQSYQIYTRWFSQVLEDVTKRGKQMRYWKETEGKIMIAQTFHASNFINWK